MPAAGSQFFSYGLGGPIYETRLPVAPPPRTPSPAQVPPPDYAPQMAQREMYLPEVDPYGDQLAGMIFGKEFAVPEAVGPLPDLDRLPVKGSQFFSYGPSGPMYAPAFVPPPRLGSMADKIPEGASQAARIRELRKLIDKYGPAGPPYSTSQPVAQPAGEGSISGRTPDSAASRQLTHRERASEISRLIDEQAMDAAGFFDLEQQPAVPRDYLKQAAPPYRR